MQAKKQDVFSSTNVVHLHDALHTHDFVVLMHLLRHSRFGRALREAWRVFAQSRFGIYEEPPTRGQVIRINRWRVPG